MNTEKAHQLQLKKEALEFGLANHKKFFTILEATLFRIDLT